MTIIPAFARVIGFFVASVLISGCAASSGPPAYAPGTPAVYAPSPYYGSPEGYYDPARVYQPAYAYDPYPVYGGSTIGFAVFGDRYYDDRRPYRGKRHKNRPHREGKRRGRHGKHGAHGDHDKSKGKHRPKGEKREGRKRRGRDGEGKRKERREERAKKRVNDNDGIVAATATVGRDRPWRPGMPRRERGSQR